MKKIKKNIARTIKNFGKLFVFACLLLPSFAICCLLGSWTTNDNNDTYYDEYYSFGNLDNIYLENGVSYENYDYDNSTLYYFSYNNSLSFNNFDVEIHDYDYESKDLGFYNFHKLNNLDVNSPIFFTLSSNDSYELNSLDYIFVNFFIGFDGFYNHDLYITPMAIKQDGSNEEILTYTYNIGGSFHQSSTSYTPFVSKLLYCGYYEHDNFNDYYEIIYFSFYIPIGDYKNDYSYYGFDIYSNYNNYNAPIIISDYTLSSNNIVPFGTSHNYIDKSLYDDLKDNYDILHDEYDSLEDQANQWYLEKRYYEDAYNQLANTIDNDIYSIDLVHYNSSDTLYDNYNVVYTFDDISHFIVSNSYLDFNAIKRAIPSLDPPIDLSLVNGIIINSSIDLSIAQYNMLFNAISSPEYYIGLYYSTKSTANQFVSYPLRVITDNGATYYFNSYSLYDVLKTQGFDNLFSDFTYNKLAIHLTNNTFQYFTINNIKLNSENGYNTGYSKGLLDSANTIASLQNNVNDLENQKIALNDRIDTLQRQLNNNLGWHSLFFSMADTPIKVVSGFLDYEILGINLFKALLGILTALAVLWLIKRFTK